MRAQSSASMLVCRLSGLRPGVPEVAHAGEDVLVLGVAALPCGDAALAAAGGAECGEEAEAAAALFEGEPSCCALPPGLPLGSSAAAEAAAAGGGVERALRGSAVTGWLRSALPTCAPASSSSPSGCSNSAEARCPCQVAGCAGSTGGTEGKRCILVSIGGGVARGAVLLGEARAAAAARGAPFTSAPCQQ